MTNDTREDKNDIIRGQHPLQAFNPTQLKIMFAARHLSRTVQTGHAAHPEATVTNIAAAFQDALNLFTENEIRLRKSVTAMVLGVLERRYYMDIMKEMSSGKVAGSDDERNLKRLNIHADLNSAVDDYLGVTFNFARQVIQGEVDAYDFGIIEEALKREVDTKTEDCDCDVCRASRGEHGAIDALLGGLFSGAGIDPERIRVKVVEVGTPMNVESFDEFAKKNPGDFLDYVRAKLEESRAEKAAQQPEDVAKNAPEAVEDNVKLVPFQAGWVRNDDPQYLASLQRLDKGDALAFMYSEGFQAKAPDEPKGERQGGDKDLRDL